MPKVSDSYLESQRQKIIDAAIICFSRKGFTETTIPEICSEAQMSTGAVYRYFQNKDDIIQASIQKHRSERSKRLAAVEEEENGQEMLDKLYKLEVPRLTSPELDNRARIIIHSYGEAITNPQIHKIVKDNWEELNGRLERIIRKAQEQGYIDSTLETHAVAVMINAIHDGLLLKKVIAPDSSQITENVLQVMKTIFIFGQRGPAESKPKEV
jgi:AcrR family transcriptional regulator